jgi:hypothetical protein
MSVTFTKLFSSITASTVWCESSDTRVVWITMLAMADKHGRVWASIPGLAKEAAVPLAACRVAIDKFLSPDHDSRTKVKVGGDSSTTPNTGPSETKRSAAHTRRRSRESIALWTKWIFAQPSLKPTGPYRWRRNFESTLSLFWR